MINKTKYVRARRRRFRDSRTSNVVNICPVPVGCSNCCSCIFLMYFIEKNMVLLSDAHLSTIAGTFSAERFETECAENVLLAIIQIRCRKCLSRAFLVRIEWRREVTEENYCWYVIALTVFSHFYTYISIVFDLIRMFFSVCVCPDCNV